MEKIGIVILNYQTWELSLRCMKSLQRTSSDLNYQIYLVDNASKCPMPDEVGRYIRFFNQHSTLGQKIQFLQAGRNRGYAAGNNIGIAKALEDACSMIIVTNNDIIFLKQAVKKLAECLATHPDIGIAGPKVFGQRHTIQISRCSTRTGMPEIFQMYTAAKWIFRRKWKEYHCLNQDPDRPADVYQVSGCCFAISRECAQKVMPFDEGTILYYEEQILGIRMEQAGYRTCYVPGSTVIHQHGATAKQVRPFLYECMVQSELYYCSRYIGAEKWQLRLLCIYRRMVYFLRCLTDKQLRNYRKIFWKNTARFYRKAINNSDQGS